MVLPCALCGSSERNEAILGELGIHSEVVIHRNCLVLCLGKWLQNKTPHYRLWKFLTRDMWVEKHHFRLLKCEYCIRVGANLSCCHVGCKRNFHTKCGVENMAVLQYGGKFDTFCAEHVAEPRRRPEPKDHCVICLGAIVNAGQYFKTAQAFQAPCCQNGWFHRTCVQYMSMARKRCLKCPLCRNKKKFAEVALFGVSIPKWRKTLPNMKKRWRVLKIFVKNANGRIGR
ncbi:G2/M phase-specific E3 ubiquitin-protein ligase-like [Drosophila kikkawai]|uniref:G2/M phase-specific E3 ubiquitin-protein ligase-like n=1 Tax=Drosophila kikkawai TaxID=30033 RepID=A0ABM4GP90_DROKI